MSPGKLRIKALQLLGLAHRAGAVRLGTKNVKESVRRGLACLVLTAEDAAEGQRDKILPLLAHRGVPHRSVGTRDAIGEALGRPAVSAVAIEQVGFAERILELMDS